MAQSASIAAIREHYDSLSRLYNSWWGEHIHHGYWEAGEDQATAQVKLIEKLAAKAGLSHGQNVLDVGCGLGGSSLWLAKTLSCRVHGITISPVQVRLATSRAETEELREKVSFEVMDANRLRFPPKSFEVIWSIECIEHLNEKKEFFKTCADLLQPGGILAFCTWLRAEDLTPEGAVLIEKICHGMLCPDLAAMKDHLQWLRTLGFREITAWDITDNVTQTWDRCAQIVQRPELQALLRISGRGIRDFADTFPLMQEAYADGSLRYGMFTART